jgi:hypothetical protein
MLVILAADLASFLHTGRLRVQREEPAERADGACRGSAIRPVLLSQNFSIWTYLPRHVLEIRLQP